MMMLNRATIVLACIGMLGGAAARADTGVVVIGGSAAQKDLATVSTAMEAVVRDAGWSLAAPLARKDTDSVLGCRDTKAPWNCIPASVTAAGIHQLLVVAVDNKQSDSGSAMVVVTGRLISTDAQAVVVKQHYCEDCADTKLTEGAASLAKQLLRDLAVRGGHTMLSIHSTPAAAKVMLDGNPVGVTDASFNTFPGKHVVILEKPGFQREIHEVEVEDGKTAELALSLHASPGTDHPPPERHRSRLVPGIAIAAGSALAAFGGYGIYLGSQDGPGDKYRYTRGTAVGIAAGVVGLGAIATAIYLLLRAPSNSAPTATATAGGAIVGWTKAF